MPFEETSGYPEGHPISEEQARRMMEGDYGNHLRSIMKAACAPIYWHVPEPDGRRPIRTNGTVTFIQSEKKVFGVTAAHVIRGYLAEAGRDGCVLQVGFGTHQHVLDLIAVDDDLDLATLQVTERVIAQMGKEIAPVSLPLPGDVPQEGRGIMIAGYIGEDRIELTNRSVGFGMLTAITVARRVNDRQITWKPDPDYDVPVKGLPPMTRHKDLGGTSGGPVIAWFEKAGGLLSYYSLAGIITEQSAELECVAATRAKFIQPDGSLRRW